MMKSEEDPITDEEWLFRRVRKEKFRTNKVPHISPNAFEPRIEGRDPDNDGISLYRAECLSDPIEALETVPPEKRHEFGIVRVSVSFLKSLGLTVKLKPDPRIKGHVVIPELNASAYKSGQARFTPIKVALATQASKNENIVKQPLP